MFVQFKFLFSSPALWVRFSLQLELHFFTLKYLQKFVFNHVSFSYLFTPLPRSVSRDTAARLMSENLGTSLLKSKFLKAFEYARFQKLILRGLFREEYLTMLSNGRCCLLPITFLIGRFFCTLKTLFVTKKYSDNIFLT